MSEVQEVSASILRFVTESPNKRLLGTGLGFYLKQAHPSFNPLDHGSRTLRDFVRKYVPQVFEAGRSGGDILYSAVPPPVAVQEPLPLDSSSAVPLELEPDDQEPRVEHRVWKTYVSPSGPYRLFANPQTGEIQVLSSHEQPLNPPWVQVPPCSPTTHLQIANDFLATITDETTKKHLMAALSRQFWWNEFLYAARYHGLDKQWSKFRRQRLWTEFKRTLDTLGIPIKTVTEGVASETAAAQYGRLSGRSERPQDLMVRRIAVGVMRRIPIEELRGIWLPLGYVIDEVQNR